jgi:hypothetical protein
MFVAAASLLQCACHAIAYDRTRREGLLTWKKPQHGPQVMQNSVARRRRVTERRAVRRM